MWRRVAGFFSRSAKKASELASQFYTPRELRAIVGFLLVGLVVLAYRAGARLWTAEISPKPTLAEIRERAVQDSLFRALSRAADLKDSLFFSLPEDSLLTGARRASSHTSKETGLRLGSISLNRGTKEDLVRLPTIGPSTADHILAYRAERGGFRTLEELKNVKGFGDKRFEKVKRFLRLN